MSIHAREETIALTLSTAAEAATLIVLGRVVAPSTSSRQDGSVTVSFQVEETLKGVLNGSPLRALLRPREGDSPDSAPGRDADGFRGLLFLTPRLLDPNDPDDPPFLAPGDAALELPFGLDPELAQDASGFADLRKHLERLLALRRSRLEIALAALAGKQPRLREESAFDIERFPDLTVLLRAGEPDLLITAMADPTLPDGPRIALLRALARVPAAAGPFLDALRDLVEADFVAGGFKIQAGQILADAAAPGDLELFRRLLDAEIPLLRGTALAGLANLGTGDALALLATTAAEHPDPDTRDLAADVLRTTTP